MLGKSARFCGKCGGEILGDECYCPHCGNRRETSEVVSVPSLLQLTQMLLKERRWGEADDCCERLLDLESNNAQALLIKLMIRAQVTKEEDLATVNESFANWNSYQEILRVADDDMKARLREYLLAAEERIISEEEKRRQQEWELQCGSLYSEAQRFDRPNSTISDLEQAIKRYSQIQTYRDVPSLLASCEHRLEKLKKEEKDREFERVRKAQIESKKRRDGIAITITAVVIALICFILGINSYNKSKAGRIAASIEGLSFSGQKYAGGSYVDNGSWGIYEEMTLYDITYSFKKNDTLDIYTIKYYSDGPLVKIDGEQQWDSIDRTTKSGEKYQVKVLFFGKPVVIIDGEIYQISLDNSDTPVSIERDSIKYSRVQ